MGKSTSDKALRDLRDKDIVEKFNHLYNLKRLRYDHVLFSMKWETFFIEEKLIRKILKRSKVEQPHRDPFNSKSHKGKTLLESRNQKVHDRFEVLFNTSGVRVDDCISKLTKEFYLNPRTLEAILRNYKVYYERFGSQQTLNFKD